MVLNSKRHSIPLKESRQLFNTIIKKNKIKVIYNQTMCISVCRFRHICNRRQRVLHLLIVNKFALKTRWYLNEHDWNFFIFDLLRKTEKYFGCVYVHIFIYVCVYIYIDFHTQIILLQICYTAAAKSLQSCPTLCHPIDGSPPGSPVPGILQTRTLQWVAISFSNAWKWKVKVNSLSRVRLLATPWTAALSFKYYHMSKW